MFSIAKLPADPDAIDVTASADDIDQVIGRRLSAFRQLRGMAVSELAPEMHMSALDLRVLEATGRALRPADLLRAAVALDIPIARLFCTHPAQDAPRHAMPAVPVNPLSRVFSK